ncbi:hypothetical protein MM300_20285 [Evansella sp. LMS18]|uniref:hypothetical protein n=1 Tax=Evansella sp. LMS18 TaxID=2924033 RepID=UPI0020D13785|nr:hypothetical protein [Evansella sp. LMS18]UTR10188.1 hypothetical protein MM300_20285 [Evansella sp. LMS18]
MKWKKLNKNESEAVMNSWPDSAPEEFDYQYKSFRDNLIYTFEHVMKKLQISKEDIHKSGYKFDLHFGMELYQLLNNHYNFNIRFASDNDLWRYISIKIIPDIVYYRWGLNPSRYWKEPRRIWIKTLWWYIHLSWQGNAEATLKVLENNTTDEIVQIVERSGPSGYRVDLSREIMFYYGNIDKELKTRGGQIFRRVMKLNTTRVKVIEPAFYRGGEREYVKELFEYFEQKK